VLFVHVFLPPDFSDYFSFLKRISARNRDIPWNNVSKDKKSAAKYKINPCDKKGTGCMAQGVYQINVCKVIIVSTLIFI
jgi:hypothetical protein